MSYKWPFTSLHYAFGVPFAVPDDAAFPPHPAAPGDPLPEGPTPLPAPGPEWDPLDQVPPNAALAVYGRDVMASAIHTPCVYDTIYTVLHCIIPFYTILYYNILYYSTLCATHSIQTVRHSRVCFRTAVSTGTRDQTQNTNQYRRNSNNRMTQIIKYVVSCSCFQENG